MSYDFDFRRHLSLGSIQRNARNGRIGTASILESWPLRRMRQFSGVAGPLAAQGGGQICRPFVLGF